LDVSNLDTARLHFARHLDHGAEMIQILPMHHEVYGQGRPASRTQPAT
jgi:hypothetical protein